MNIYDYIKLGIKNGFKSYKNYRNFVIDFGNNPDFIYSNILAQNKEIEVITSKEFIESISKSLLKLIYEEDGFYIFEIRSLDYIIATKKEGKKGMLKRIIQSITYRQAIAIRDCELEEFINKLKI